MAETFKVTSQMKKQEIIDEHKRLLEAYREKVKEAKEAGKRASEAEKHKVVAATKVATEATVEGVIRNVGELRSQVGKTLNDLTEKMSARAEELESLKAAVTLRKESWPN